MKRFAARLFDILYPAFILSLAATLIAIAVFWQRFKYEECKRVGHSTTYCMLAVGGK